MKQITLQIPDQEYAFFMKLIQRLNFVEVTETQAVESKLTPSQRKTWENIKQGFEELKLIEQGTMKAQSAEEFLQELKEEGYL